MRHSASSAHRTPQGGRRHALHLLGAFPRLLRASMAYRRAAMTHTCPPMTGKLIEQGPYAIETPSYDIETGLCQLPR